MSDESFRILLNATYLNLEEFKYVWINVLPRELRTISDLKNYVLRKINVEGHFNLYMNNGLLLDEDTVTILRENDVVQIKYKTPNPAAESPEQCANFSRKRNFTESDNSNDVCTKKQKLEIKCLSSVENETNFVKKKSKKKNKSETKLSISSESFSNSEEKRQRESQISSNDFCSISMKQKRKSEGKSNACDKDANSKKCELEIVGPSSYGNMDKCFEKKSVKGKKKEETELPICSENFSCNSLEKKKNQNELFINSGNICYISVEQRKKQTESSLTFEHNYPTLFEENQSSKKSCKIKDKKKLPITCASTVADIDGECSSKNIAVDFFAKDLDYSSQKEKGINKASKTMVYDAKKVFTVTSIDSLSSKGEFNISQCESSSTIISDINSEEMNNNMSKIKHNKHKKYEENTQTMNSSMTISTNGSSSIDEFNRQQNESPTFVIDINSEGVNNNQPKKKRKRHRKRKTKTNIDITNESNSCHQTSNVISSSENIDESVKRKHILYLSPERKQENNYINNVNEFPNSLIDKSIIKHQSLVYPKMSTPAQSKIYTVPDLQLSVLTSQKSKLCDDNPCDEIDLISPDKATTESTALQSSRENKKKQLYENLPNVTTLPIVGTCIAYKTLELDESYSPIASDYREGIVENYDPDTEELQIRLVNQVILPAKSGKFENLEKDEVPEPTVKTYDVLKWSDLIEPKLLKSLPE